MPQFCDIWERIFLYMMVCVVAIVYARKILAHMEGLYAYSRLSSENKELCMIYCTSMYVKEKIAL